MLEDLLLHASKIYGQSCCDSFYHGICNSYGKIHFSLPFFLFCIIKTQIK